MKGWKKTADTLIFLPYFRSLFSFLWRVVFLFRTCGLNSVCVCITRICPVWSFFLQFFLATHTVDAVEKWEQSTLHWAVSVKSASTVFYGALWKRVKKRYGEEERKKLHFCKRKFTPVRKERERERESREREREIVSAGYCYYSAPIFMHSFLFSALRPFLLINPPRSNSPPFFTLAQSKKGREKDTKGMCLFVRNDCSVR